MWSTALYNCVMAVITVTALWGARRDVRPRACFLATIAVGAAALLLAISLGGSLGGGPFGALRLLAYGLFVFVAAVWAGATVMLWRSRRLSAALFASGFLLLEGVAVDAFFIEPHWLEVSRVRIATDKLGEPVKIALLADLQTDEIGDYERFVIERIVAERPALILLAGDYLQESHDEVRRHLQANLRRLLKEAGFSAPLGCYAVRGNVDGADWSDCFTGTDVRAVTKTQSFDVDNLKITCLSMADSFSTILAVAPADQYHIVVGHCPNFALGNVPGDLLLAGHCHGGQVRLPGIGPVLTFSRVPRSWAAGVTELGGGRVLIVSRGVGMERGLAPRLRFLCRPELVFIELAPP